MSDLGAERPRISMCMIVRDEARNMRAALSSFWDAVDECVIVDTGSRDRTLDAARRFARERGEADKLIVDRFDWCDDFSAARNHAHDLASGDWHCWSDGDDLVIGAEHLRRLAARAPAGTTAYFFKYEYNHPSIGAGDPGCWQPRLFRRGVGRWRFPVYERWEPYDDDDPASADAQYAPPRLVVWQHRRRDGWDGSFRRNDRLLRLWAQRSPNDPQMLLCSAGNPLRARKDPAAAAGMCGRVLRMRSVPRSVRAHAGTLLAEISWELLGDAERARRAARRALREVPELPAAPRLVLARIALARGQYETAVSEARAGLERSPLQSKCMLHVTAAHALFELGQLEEARDELRPAVALTRAPMVASLYRDLCAACGGLSGWIASTALAA